MSDGRGFCCPVKLPSATPAGRRRYAARNASV